MPLLDLPVPAAGGPVPAEVRRFLRAADERIDEFLQETRAPAFVPSDYAGAFAVLRGLEETAVLRGTRFCEWGSGFGVVAGLAAGLGFDAAGIEAEAGLVAAARALADDFDLPVEFAHGSFVPRGAEDRVHAAGEYAWLTTGADYAYAELGVGPDDFDVVYAYPWPDEEVVTAELFERYGGRGAVLVTYHAGDGFRVRRKVGRRPGGRRG